MSAVKTTPVIEAKIIAALATGMTAQEVARAFGVHRATVYRLAKKGDNPELLAELRLQMRVKILEALAEATPEVLEWLGELVRNPTSSARDIDALSRAALSLEKVAASVSGENRAVQQRPEKGEVKVVVAPFMPAEASQPRVIDATPAGDDAVI